MYEKELSVALNSAKKAGDILCKYHRSKIDVSIKKDESPVTIADRESNELILKMLSTEFPDDGIISEELAEVQGKRKWHIDPLDGTRSFICGSDDFSIHIGLCVDDKPVLGVVYLPAKKQMFYAVKNQGAIIEQNGKKIKLNSLYDSTKKIVAAISSNDEKNEVKDVLTSKILTILEIKNTLRSGSTGCRFMELVKGNADVHVPPSIKFSSWDYCAPQIILEEAGGKMLFQDGEEIKYTSSSVGNGKLIIAANSIELMNLTIEKLKIFSYK
jgi:3'(2'), 5'-bisphosphate nucleotidase